MFWAFWQSAVAQVEKSPIPNWVKSVSLGNGKVGTGEGGFRYLVLDRQYHLPTSTVFFHFQYQLISTDAVQEYSDITVDFDPTFQELVFHQIQIVRDGKIMDQLAVNEVELIRREADSDVALYDGNLTAVVHLSDVRKNDVVLYSYSIKGFNPAYGNHFFAELYHGFTVPVDRFHYRVITDSSQKLYFTKLNHDKEPELQEREGIREYFWEDRDVPALTVENNLSPWELLYPITSISTQQDWGEVVRWALPFYETGEVPRVSVERGSKLETINALITAVQDDVRYLGLEDGISAYKPYSPMQVWNQKFGDCKDKSLLLAALLRKEGINAFPMLVNTEYRHHVRRFQPSPIAFDHCVVMYEFEGEEYFVDPTISNQKGELASRYFPDYGMGLPIKPGITALISLPAPKPSEVRIKESYTVHGIGGDASLRIETTYIGERADDIRAYFEDNPRDQIQREYRDFYHNLYEGIESAYSVEFTDEAEGALNAVRTVEHYRIPEFWSVDEVSDMHVARIYPLVLESMTNYAGTPARSSPYYLGPPFHFIQESVVHLPEAWNVAPEEKKVETDELFYHGTVGGAGDKVYVSYTYTQRKKEVSAERVTTFLKDYQTVENDWMFYLSYQPPLEGFKLDTIAVIFAVLIMGVGGFLGWRLYVGYDPAAWRFAENKAIGGWLILPTIGITLAPVRLLIEFMEVDFFNQHVWTSLEYQGLKSVMVFSFVVNIALFVYVWIVLVHFYARRTSLPMLITFFYAANLFIVVVDHYLSLKVLQLPASELGYRDIGNALLSACIWIPYFRFSERAKSTFCKTYEHQSVRLT